MERSVLQARNFFFDRMLPVRLFYTRCSEVADWHSHEFTEIAIVLAGRAVYETEFSETEIAAGDVLVMPAGGAHRFRDETGIEQFNVLFQFEKLPVPSRDIAGHPGFSALFRLNSGYCRKMRHYPRFRIAGRAELERVRRLLAFAWRDQEERRPGYALSVYGAFLLLIPILLENYRAAAPGRGTPCSPDRLADCLDFMSRSFRRPLTTALLAAKAGMAPASFVRHFHAATGCTPREYLIRMRLDEARQLLLKEDLTVAEVAQQAGFADSNYFSRLFRRKNALTPREYRKIHR